MRDVLVYSVKRFGQGLLTIVAISMLVFFLVRIFPTNPIDSLAGPDSTMTESQKQEITQRLGLDKPITTQYAMWISGLLRGDMGTSILGRSNIARDIKLRLPYTLILSFSTMICTWLIAIPLGILTAFRQNKFIDKFLISITTVISSMPSFWVALLMVYVFAIKLKIFPIVGWEGPISFVLPVLTNSLFFGGLMRITRSEVIATKNEKHVITAYSKGLTQERVTTAHVLRNSIIPITIMAISGLPGIIGGSVITEQIFGLPGMGTYMIAAITNMDYPIVQIQVLILASLTVVCNLVGDILVAVLDPRARTAVSRG